MTGEGMVATGQCAFCTLSLRRVAVWLGLAGTFRGSQASQVYIAIPASQVATVAVGKSRVTPF